MKPEKLMDAIGEVDEALLSKTEKGAMVSPRRLTSFLAVAACFCLIVGAGVAANRSGFFGYKAEGPVAEAPAAEAPMEEPAAEEPVTAPEEAEPPAGEHEEMYDVVLLDTASIDGGFRDWLDDTCESKGYRYAVLSPEELRKLLGSDGWAQVVIVDEADWELVHDIADEYPEIEFCTPEKAKARLPEGLQMYAPIRTVTIDGEPIETIDIGGVLYTPASSFREEYPQMIFADDGGSAWRGIQIREGSPWVYVDGARFYLNDLPITLKNESEEIYLPAEEFGAILPYNIDNDFDNGVCRLYHNPEPVADGSMLVLKYGPGTTPEALEWQLKFVLGQGLTVGSLSDLGAPLTEQEVCFVMEPGSFTEFGALQEVQYNVDENVRLMLSVLLDPANLGALTEESCSDWFFVDTLPYYFCVTPETAADADALAAALDRSKTDALFTATDDVGVAVCPESCRALAEPYFRCVIDDTGTVTLDGERLNNVTVRSVPADITEEEFITLLNEAS